MGGRYCGMLIGKQGKRLYQQFSLAGNFGYAIHFSLSINILVIPGA